MSSPENGAHGASTDDRKLTLIIVPHGDLETRTFEISYGRLKFALAGVSVFLLLFIVVLAFWFPIAAQAGRVPGLVNELERLETERAKVAELARTLAEVEAQYERVRQLLGADAPEGGGQPVLPPLRDTTATDSDSSDETAMGIIDQWPLTTRGFVTRHVSAGRESHTGLDIAVARNSFVRAAGPGIVTATGTDPVYGLYVLVDHGRGLQSLYGHAEEVLVKTGLRVDRDDVLAMSGSSGRSTAPHLHFEIRRDGRVVDPLQYVRQP